jgi:heme exporter protein A
VTAAAVAARGLEKRYGPVAALRGVDLELPAGSALAVLGPNGAGKTTLLRLLAGLSRPTQGSLWIEGVPAGRATRARIGFVGHASLLYPALSARENLLFAARLYAVADPRARADALLRELALDDVATRPAGGFSRGMAQRLAIARALVHEPSILVLDEPFSGLDAASQAQLAARLRRMRETGHTLVLATHEVARACALADVALVLARGRVARLLGDGPLSPAELERASAPEP